MNTNFGPRPPRPSGGNRFRPAPPPREDEHNINEFIRSDPVRLVGADGAMVGIVPLSEALAAAVAAGLDLVELSPNAEPPVCKVLDYGKYRYEAQKKAKEAKKKQKVINIKEIKVRPNIDVHDYEVKLKAAKRFFEEGDKVKITLRFRGREMSHIDLAKEVLERFQKDLVGVAKAEHEARLEGRQMVIMMVPEGHK